MKAPLALSTAATIFALFASTAHADGEWQSWPVAQVHRIVDADTVDVDMPATTRLRLIGLDTPETVDPRKPVQCFGREASAHAHALLDGQWVAIESDSTQGQFDRYQRTLAYVWLPDGRNYEQVMIAEGYGHEYDYRPSRPYRYRDTFKQAQRDAQANLLGLWAITTCGGKA